MENIKRSRFIVVLLIIAMSAFFVGCGSSDTDTGEAELYEPSIGISWMEDPATDEHSEDLQVYIDAVKKSGGEPELLELIENEDQAKEVVDSVEAIIMTGGEDIDPSNYDEEPDKMLEEVNEPRDKSDLLLIKAAIDADKPVLATCRGLQVLNVALGGTLYQDIPTQVETDILHRSLDQVDFAFHPITVEEGTLIEEIMGKTKLDANSWHHQCIKDLGEGLKVTATSADGVIEAVEYEDATFILGVQFHPEWHVAEGQTEYQLFFDKLVELTMMGVAE